MWELLRLSDGRFLTYFDGTPRHIPSGYLAHNRLTGEVLW